MTSTCPRATIRDWNDAMAVLIKFYYRCKFEGPVHLQATRASAALGYPYAGIEGCLYAEKDTVMSCGSLCTVTQLFITEQFVCLCL